MHFLSFFGGTEGRRLLRILIACDPNAKAFRYPATHQKAKKLATGNFFHAFCPLRVRLPPNIHKKAKEAHLAVHFSCFFWWNRGESNPCPKTYSHRHLRAQSLIKNSLRRKASDSPSGFGSFIRHAWCKA